MEAKTMKQGKLVRLNEGKEIGRIVYVIPSCVLETNKHGDYCKVQIDVLQEKWFFEDEFEIIA